MAGESAGEDRLAGEPGAIEVNDKPLREIQPVVIPAHFFLGGTLASAFVAFFPGVFAMIVSNMLASAFTRSHEPVLIYGALAWLLAFGSMMYVMWAKTFREPSQTRYTIYPNRVEYEEGLWNRRRRTVMLDQVIDVELVEGVLQQPHGAGTITLVMQQMGQATNGRVMPRRAALANVPDPRGVYDLLRSLAIKSAS
jgi:hypothetical protein